MILGSPRAKILVVEDESDIRELLVLQLSREGYEVSEVADGESAYRQIQSQVFDLILLDWMLPGASGVELARALRGSEGRPGSTPPQVPILMLTARADAGDIVMGLESGADDYLTKPFEGPVLRARVRALLRRSRTSSKSEPLASSKSEPKTEQSAPVLEGLHVDEGAVEAFCGKERLELTHSEFKLLSALLQNQGKVMTRNQLIQCVQGSGVSVVDRAIDTHIFGLRKKLGPCAEQVETVRGVGYRIRSD